jgi:glycosyl transferase family WbsX
MKTIKVHRFGKTLFIVTLLTALNLNVLVAEGLATTCDDQSPGYTVAAYYCALYHADPRFEEWCGPGWTMWELTKWARPRFQGHDQPKVPIWGYEDDSDPEVVAKKIDMAAKHGVDVLIVNWYWYNDGTFLRAGLDKGILGANNNHKVKFALHWCNHDMPDIFPTRSYQCYPDWKVLMPGDVNRETFDKMVDEIIEKYFKHPSYWLIEGCPYFSVYDLDTLVKGLGDIEKTKEALDSFRAKTKKAGFPDLHLNIILRGDCILTKGSTLVLSSDEDSQLSVYDQNELALEMGFNSLGSYTWVHHVALPNFPTTQYAYAREKAVENWHDTVKKFSLPYYAVVTCGWDSTPEICPSDVYVNKGYPYMPTLVGNTPEEFKKSLIEMKKFLDDGGNKQKIFLLNSWNEWNEGTHLEPDKKNGYGFLEAIKKVFGSKE